LARSPASEPDSREATVSSRGFVPVEYRSAGLERSPLAVPTGHGVFLDAPDSRNGSREFLSWSSAPLQSSSVPHPPVLLHRCDPRKREPNRSGTRVRLSWGSCPFERNYVGCPFSSHPGSVSGQVALAVSEIGASRARDANPSPVPSSGFLPLSTDLARSRRVRDLLQEVASCAVTARRFAALFHAARVPGAPFRAFSSRGAVPALAGRCFLAGSRSTSAGAALDQLLAIAFPDAPALCRTHPLAQARTTQEPGRRFPAVARPTGLTRLRAPSRSTSSSRPGSPVRGRHARFEALLPPGARSRDDPMPWPGRGRRVGALVGFFPPRACSSTTPGPVSRAGAREPGTSPGHARQWRLSHPVSITGPEPRRLGTSSQDPPAHAVDRTARTTVGQRLDDPRCSQHREPLVACLPRPLLKRSELDEAVAPALPLGSAPRLPRPSRPAPPSLAGRFGYPTLDLGDALLYD